MKSLLITEIFPPKVGGSGRWFWEVYSRLSRQDYIVAAGNDERATAFDSNHDLPCVRWPLFLPTWGIISTKGFLGYARLFKLLRSLIKQEDIKALHCGRCLPEGFLGWLAWKWMGIPYLCYVHGEELQYICKSRELYWLSRLVFSGARLVIVNSKNTQRLVNGYRGVVQNRIRLLRPGVDTTYFRSNAQDIVFRAEFGWKNRLVILTVGRLQKRKGQDYTILAVKKVKQVIPNVLYAIVGNGEERQYLEGLVIREGLQQYVRFFGEIDQANLLACYQQCDLFVLANREVDGDIEGFGMVLVEAQSCGKPVIAGNSGGTAETMIRNETGLLVDCRYPDLIAEAIIDLLRDTEKRAVMGNQAVKWVRENFDWESLIVRAENIFEELSVKVRS